MRNLEIEITLKGIRAKPRLDYQAKQGSMGAISRSADRFLKGHSPQSASN
jgi:hypothetical protein